MFKIFTCLFIFILYFGFFEAKLDWWDANIDWPVCVRIFEGGANEWCHTAYLNYTQCHATALYCCHDEVICSKWKLGECCMPLPL